MFKLVKRYFIVFLLFYIFYTFLSWWLTTKAGWIKIDKDYDFFGAAILAYPFIFFFLRPVVKQLSYNSKTKDGLIWGLMPLSFILPTTFSQDYFRDVFYKVIQIKTPEEVCLYPRERFFTIDHFTVFKNEFSLFKERHVKRKTLDVNNYYIAPLYADSTDDRAVTAYGIKYHTSLNNGYFSKDGQPEKIRIFNEKSAAELADYNFYEVGFFERSVGSDDATNFSDAWKTNEWLDPTVEPVILVSRKETFKSFITHERNISICSVLISVGIVIGVLFWIDFKNARQASVTA